MAFGSAAPLGVVGVIYEARPTAVDVGFLCLKTGNAVILRGGKTHRTNAATVRKPFARRR